MPRSIHLALAAAGALAALGAAGIALRAVGAFPLRVALPSALDGAWIAGATCLFAGVLHRDGRVRRPVALACLAAALGSGVLFGPAAIVLGVVEGTDPEYALMLVEFVLLPTTIAVALSRPSARAWFGARAAA